jgi:hypothetical protein
MYVMQQDQQMPRTSPDERSKTEIIVYTDELEYLRDALECFPCFNPDEAWDYIEQIELLVEREVQAAFERMKSILSGKHIRYISVFADIGGGGFGDDGVAALQYGSCKPSEGIYYFTASSRMIYHALKCHFDSSLSIPRSIPSTWDHELIHLADLDNILNADSLIHENSIASMYDFHLLHFRIEGLANLLSWMESASAVTDMDIARQLYVDERARIKPFLENPEDQKFSKSVDDVRDSFVFYDIGPLMVMDLLSRSINPEVQNAATLLLDLKRQGLDIDYDLRMDVVQKALAFDNQAFLEGFAEWSVIR